MVDVQDLAPDFSLPGSDGATHALSAHRGRPVVLYFYPRDSTPGCTREACDFRDNLDAVTERGAVVYGVSPDSLESHRRFIDQHDLNFVLLSDEDHAVHERYGAWGEKKNYGRVYQGVIRSTFVIDAEGRIAALWRNLRVKGHVARVLEALAALE